ncbi:uncharacterized protein LOC125655333 [Ostrea edulis]|uniref:uncharacterized protein LOC125655333 n=1 Tax=Ostrea edulis TaxID=37623 RepID=UPI0024AEA0F9|nr:uncharacterized protein LOC125655333 [Ostrea edulis]XP_056000412.1 uncharacterized protein LOC125655333 [Ostrea edulis]
MKRPMALFNFQLLFVVLVAEICYTANAFSVEELCKGHNDIRLAHDTECQLYYDCSSSEAPSFAKGEKYLRECKYPQLFSTRTLRCEDFQNVRCDRRKELKQACDYRANQCNGPNCISCKVMFPSCEGYDDGEHPHSTKEGSPWKMECYKERLMKTFIPDTFQRRPYRKIIKEV